MVAENLQLPSKWGVVAKETSMDRNIFEKCTILVMAFSKFCKL